MLKKPTNLHSVTVKTEPSLDKQLANKNYIDDELDKNTILCFNQTIQNYLKVSVGNDTYNLTNYNKNQLTDTTIIETGNGGGYLFPSWRRFCNDQNNNGKKNKFKTIDKNKLSNGQ